MPAPRNGRDREGLGVPWSRSERPFARVFVRPLQNFLATETSSGALLLVMAIVALVWANSPWHEAYEDLWHTKLGFSLGTWSLELDLHHWINDALMAIFFFVVGLEIKREITSGELRDPRAAALPIFGALGGMIAPALIYTAFNLGGEGSAGWGIPMATDIAFAVGLLAIVGRGLPESLRVFLLALAIGDDIGGILVIAIFYSSGLSWGALAAAGALLVAIVVMQRAKVRARPVYAVFGVLVWYAVFQSGVHATIAGVALGLITPSRPFHSPAAASRAARTIADDTNESLGTDEPVDTEVDEWLQLRDVAHEAISPLAHLEHLLHPWTSYVIVPLFALANAGVRVVGGDLGEALTHPVALGVALGLVAGKIIGISLAARLAVSLGWARLGAGVRWFDLVGVAAVAGIGFTVSLFIASLAFPQGDLLDSAKVGILGGSLLAGVIGAVMLRVLRRQPAAASRATNTP